MNYTHLTINERVKIEGYLDIGYSIRKISTLLKRVYTTILRELKRNQIYKASNAQTNRQLSKKRCGAKLKLTQDIKEAIEQYLKLSWSPEQIVDRLYQGLLSFKSIYRWIYKQLISVSVKQREIFEHWELDTVVSSRDVAKGCVATFVERKTRWYTAILIKDRSADSMKKAIKLLYNKSNHPIIQLPQIEEKSLAVIKK